MQTRRPPARRSLWESGLWYLLFSLPIGAGMLLACLLALAGMMMLADAAEWMLSLMAAVALLLSGYAMGRFAGFHRRHHGLKTGLVCGLMLYLVLLLLGLVWQDTGGGLLRPVCLLAGGGWGGVSGVNAQHKKPPR